MNNNSKKNKEMIDFDFLNKYGVINGCYKNKRDGIVYCNRYILPINDCKEMVSVIFYSLKEFNEEAKKRVDNGLYFEQERELEENEDFLEEFYVAIKMKA